VVVNVEGWEARGVAGEGEYWGAAGGGADGVETEVEGGGGRAVATAALAACCVAGLAVVRWTGSVTVARWAVWEGAWTLDC
jgi:hypothetical protein